MRLIDADKLQDYFWDNRSKIFQSKDCRIAIDNAPTVEAIPVTEKAFEMFETDYKNRLKADLEAILVELQLEIEELPTNRMAITDSSGLINYGYSEYEPTAKDASKVIQQKINELKADQEGEE